MTSQKQEREVTFKGLFVPFTTLKAIHWIIFIGFVVYFNALFNGFVWDDKTYIINNSGVHTVNIINAFTGNFFNQGGQYRPIPVLYFSLLYALFNTLPFFYHFTQISIHIINGVLVFILFRRFLNKPLAFFLSLLFLIHPLQVESVSYIGATGNNLFFLFGISALLLVIKIPHMGKKTLVLIFGLLLLSLLSKETGGLFLVMMLVYSFIYDKGRMKAYSICALLALVIYFLIRFFIGNVYFEKSDLVTIARLSFQQRILNVPSIMFYYFKNFIYPAKLAIGQVWVIIRITIENFYLPLFLEVIFSCANILFAGYLLKTNKEKFTSFLFFFLWFFVGLVFHSQIFPLDWTVSDRWFYFPIVGLLGIIGIFLQSVRYKKKSYLFIYCIIATVIVVALSIRTIVRNTNWSDAITLYSHDTKITSSWDLENNLGYEYKALDNQPEALKHYLEAVKLFPFESTYLNSGIVYGNMGNQQKEIEYYYKALGAKHYPTSAHKHNVNTYTSLINSLLITSQTEMAQKITLEALNDYPNEAILWSELAITQQWLHDDMRALASATKARQIESTQFTNFIYQKILRKEKISIYSGKNKVSFL